MVAAFWASPNLHLINGASGADSDLELIGRLVHYYVQRHCGGSDKTRSLLHLSKNVRTPVQYSLPPDSTDGERKTRVLLEESTQSTRDTTRRRLQLYAHEHMSLLAVPSNESCPSIFYSHSMSGKQKTLPWIAQTS